jgi:hypothetical protein
MHSRADWSDRFEASDLVCVLPSCHSTIKQAKTVLHVLKKQSNIECVKILRTTRFIELNECCGTYKRGD